MRATRFNSLSQLAVVMTGFVVTILLLESEALTTWADRLDVGPGRTAAVRVTSALQQSLRPLGVAQLREISLDGLDRLGWTDDPARLMAARERILFGNSGSTTECSVALRRPKSAVLTPASPGIARIPVPTGVPRSTTLAPLPPAAPGQPRVVALVGDSMMAVGLSDVLLRQTAGDQNLRVIRAFKSGTGLARPDVFDWMQEYPAMIGIDKPDAIIVAMGANDGQGIVDNGKAFAFGSDAWVKAYQQRTAGFLSLLTQNGAHVVWVGLPPMKSDSYNQRAAEINRIAYSVVSQNPLATWWNPQTYIGDDAGGFRDFLTTSDGKTTRIRQADGIHLSDEGAALLTPSLLRWLNPVPPVATAQVTRPDSTPAAPNRPRKLHARAARP
jgi:uncharacterized protein